MRIRFVLVEPKVPENIGAGARAIKTMGFDSLVLVNPCEWKEGKARWVAHGSGDILDNAVVFSTLEQALEGSDFSMATSAKKRTVKNDYVPASRLKKFLESKMSSANVVSIVFGREESGLTNDEMKLCDITATIEMKTLFPSLNLSQAVMLFAYELSGMKQAGKSSKTIKETGSFKALKSRMSTLLKEIGIDESDNRYGRILERLSFLSDDDIHLLHSVSALLSEKFDSEK